MLRSAQGWVAAGCAALAPALYWVGAGVAPTNRTAASETPTMMATAVNVARVATAAVPPAQAASAASIEIRRVGVRWHLAVVDADRRQVMERLAVESGSTLFGSEQLPASLGRVTLNAAGVEPAAAWQLLLDTAPLGFAIACDAIRCKLWLAPVETAGATQAMASATPAAATSHRRVESTEGEN